MKRFLYLLCALAFCLALTPSTALAAAPNGQVIYVGNENVTNGGYWTTSEDGQTITSVGDSQPSSGGYIHYDADNNTLTLHNATIKESVSTDTSTLIPGAAIGVLNQKGAAELTITLEGTNTIAEVGNGIYVLASSTGGATLTITGDGSLDASGSQTGIRVQSNNGNASLGIENAKVTATSSFGFGVVVQSGSTLNASLAVDGGSLTATAQSNGVSGIGLWSGTGGTSDGTHTVTVGDNAIIRANGSAGGITSDSTNGIQYTGNGIVFDGNTGTVYGNVTLDEDLTINEGETLTIPEGSTLDTNGKLTNNGIIVNTGGTLNGEPGGTGTIEATPTITKQPESQTVAENATATFTVEATGGNLSYQWQQSTDGTDWTDISGANSDTYTTEAATTDMNGRQYRCKVSNSAGSVTSDAAILTVNQHEHEWGEPAWTWGEDGKTVGRARLDLGRGRQDRDRHVHLQERRQPHADRDGDRHPDGDDGPDLHRERYDHLHGHRHARRQGLHGHEEHHHSRHRPRVGRARLDLGRGRLGRARLDLGRGRQDRDRHVHLQERRQPHADRDGGRHVNGEDGPDLHRERRDRIHGHRQA